MATLTIPNVPPFVLAARANRTVEEEVLSMPADYAARPGNDDTRPLDFPRPLDGPRVVVTVQPGGERLPAPLAVEESRPE